MALQRFNSNGSPLSPSTSSSKPSTRLPRLSSNMVSLRYEDAVQAAPPIMVTTARRCTSNNSNISASSISTDCRASTASSVYSAISTSTSSSTDSSHYASRINRSRSTRSCAPSSFASSSSSLSTSSSSRLSSATSVASVSTSPTSPRCLRIPRSPTLASPPASPASPTSPRPPLVIPRASSLAAPPVEQHPALRRTTSSAACRPIVEETADVVDVVNVVKRPAPACAPQTKTTGYKRPAVSHMKEMIPLKTVAMNLPLQNPPPPKSLPALPKSLPAPPGPPPQRPPPPVPTSRSSSSSSSSTRKPSVAEAKMPLLPAQSVETKQPALQPALPKTDASPVASPVTHDAPAVPSKSVPPITPTPPVSTTPMPTSPPPTPKTAKENKEKTWRKVLTFRSHRKKSADSVVNSVVDSDSASAGPILPMDTALITPNSPSGGSVETPAPILASPLAHASYLYKNGHAPKQTKTQTQTNTKTGKTKTDTANTDITIDAPFPCTSPRPYSSASFAFSLSSVSTAHSASTATTAVPVVASSSPSRPTGEKQQPPSSPPPPPSHFYMSDSPRQSTAYDGTAAHDSEPAVAHDDLPRITIDTAIPTELLIEDDLLASLSFSKRGSLMFGGKRAAVTSAVTSSMASYDAPPPAVSPAVVPPTAVSSVVPDSQPRLAPAVERESSQVRSLYGTHNLNWEDGRPPSIAIVSPPDTASETAASSPPAVNSSLMPSSTHSHPTMSTMPTTPTTPTTPTAEPPDPSRLSIVSATSIATTSTGIALSGTESSLSLATPQPTSNPASPRRPTTPSSATTTTNTAGVAYSSSSPAKDSFELAGGIEDWEDVDVADVDRYGFIRAKPRPLTSASSSGMSSSDADGMLTRPGTGLSTSSGISRHFSRPRKSMARSMYTNRSTSTTATAAAAARSSLRAAANQLPYNKDRKWIDEAGGMLAMEPGLGDIAEDEDTERLAELAKRKEWKRAEKWRRMATVIVRGGPTDADADVVNTDTDTSAGVAIPDGSGMDFTFDLQQPKLVERTWKGIPDRWRAPAWYSFLASSAQHRRAQRVPPLPPVPPLPCGRGGDKDKAVVATPVEAKPDGGETAEQIIAAFYRLLETASPDDVQIDLDVPRTVNGHVMFRKRYRGGQRLLFRVLHALSLYFPAMGYVQGMAALAATLLCYYDEERCFVMLVRLFHLRGLERLYEPGFGGLMEALGEFEQTWLARNSPRLAHKLEQLNIDATTYATRWYLTLFNLSVPFPAQLRIWDVFMLLGDGSMPVGPASSNSTSTSATRKRPSTAGAATRPETADAMTAQQLRPGSAGHDAYLSATALITASAPKPLASRANLDILHATSTALIDGLQEVLQDADFENAMKAVTSWVPIKDENLLMKVVHAEWKRHQRMK